MQPSYAYYKDLLSGFIRNTLTEAQGRELYAFIAEQPAVYEQLMEDPDITALIALGAESSDAVLAPVADQRVRTRVLAHATGEGVQTATPRVVVMKGRKTLLRWSVAAAVLVLLGFTTWFLLLQPRQRQLAQGTTAAKPVADKAAPVRNHATITLANGTVVAVDSLRQGLAAGQATRVVARQDGQVAYEPTSGGAGQELVYNTLSNPRGSKVVDITLSDGSRVWLNAGSSLTYPVAFTGSERQVRISGEAYFEIAPDPHKPFLVTKNGMEVQVLGTHFNINAYDNAAGESSTTLLEGAVRVKQGAQQVTLQPGQQARSGATIHVISNVNVNQVVAWKNGYFNFENMRLPDVMQQLEVWYDVSVVYEGVVPDIRFYGELRRDTNLSGVISALEDSGVHFKVEGNKLIVLP